MNAWLSLVESWLIDFALLATAVMSVALLMRLVLRDARSRVMLACRTWMAITVGALLTAMPVGPRYEMARLLKQRHAMTTVVAASPDFDARTVSPLVIDESSEAPLSPADVAPQNETTGTKLVPVVSFCGATSAGLSGASDDSSITRGDTVRASKSGEAATTVVMACLCLSSRAISYRGPTGIAVSRAPTVIAIHVRQASITRLRASRSTSRMRSATDITAVASNAKSISHDSTSESQAFISFPPYRFCGAKVVFVWPEQSA